MPDAGAAFDEFNGMSLVALVAGFVALACWLVAFGYRWWRTRPDLPAAGPEVSQLPPDPESPAVVNFLVHNWRVTSGAIAATLVDLAARRHLGLDLVGRDGTVVRLRDEPPPGSLTPYEQQVYALVRSRATGGSAPIEAISLDNESDSRNWTRKFEKAVVHEARSRGLARRRWETVDYFIVGIGLAVVFGLFALAFASAHVGERPGESGSIAPSDWLIAGSIAWTMAIVLITRSQATTDTPAGRAACARWLGMRDYFRRSDAFEGQPPASVAIWERLLAYGIATGSAHDADRGLPIADGDPNTAWSRRTGTWRELRIEYPERLGFGRRPLYVFAGGLVRTAISGAIAFFLLAIVAPAAWDILDETLDTFGASTGQANTIFLGLGAFLAAIAPVLTVQILIGLARLVRGGLDLGRSITIEGPVVKVHGVRFAIDDGQDSSLVALFQPPGGPRVRWGQHVRAVVSPRLRYLSAFTVLAEPPAGPDSAAQ